MAKPPDLVAMDRFLAEPRNAAVGGIRADGRLHMTPNWFLWEDGRFFISTTKDRVKYRMFVSNPRVQLLIDDVMDFRYVLVDGSVEVSDDVDNGLHYFRELRIKHGRTEQDGKQLRDEMIRDERVLLTVTPDKPQSAWPSRGF